MAQGELSDRRGARLLVFQSLWAMERRHSDGIEPALDDKVAAMAAAGFDGISFSLTDEDRARRLGPMLATANLGCEALVFPQTIDDLAGKLDLAAELGAHHVTVQGDVRPRDFRECVRLMDGWQRLGERSGLPVFFENHRNRLMTDLLLILDLLDCFPDLKLTVDLSHIVVGRELLFPVTAENEAHVACLLRQAHAFHGRVASSEQVQLPLSWPCHADWLGKHLDWWQAGFQNWLARPSRPPTLSFTCELGPRPYAIVGPDGNDIADRWAEALLLRRLVLDRFERAVRTVADAAGP